MIASDTSPDFSLFRSSCNLLDTALDVIRPIVLGDNAVIIVGYENLMSVLAMVMALRPGLTFADRSALRILLTEQGRPAGRVPHPAGLTADRLVAHYLRPSGVHIPDPRDLRAIGARDAVASGAIKVRVANPSRLKRAPGRRSGGIQVNMAVGEDFAALSTAGFSRRDLMDRAVMIDRVASDGAAFTARRNAAELFWSAANPCNREVGKILDAMLVPISMDQAVSIATDATLGYAPFRIAGGTHPVREELVGQALGRVYENGFAFVCVPPGAGQQDIEIQIESGLAANAARMIGGVDRLAGLWGVHVETAKGGMWGDEKTLDILSARAPLALDGSVSIQSDETLARAALRRMKCRLRSGSLHQGISGFEGFPEIVATRQDIGTTKPQRAAYLAAMKEISLAHEGALDRASEKELAMLARIAAQSSDAALLVWKQSGMGTRVRTTAKIPSRPALIEQHVLPMFAAMDDEEGEGTDGVAEALAARSFRALDKNRVSAILASVAREGQVLCLIEDDVARHALARRAVEMGDVAVLAVIEESALRRCAIPGREVSYQRAESPAVAMSMIPGNEGGPLVILASCAQASEMTLGEVSMAVVVSLPDCAHRVAAGLSCIDGMGKRAERISCVVLEDALCGSGSGQTDSSGATFDLVAAAAVQMRACVEESMDGVADILGELRDRLPGEIIRPPYGRVNMTVVESRQEFSVFVIAGTADAADQAMMPPRLIVIRRDPATGEEIVLRNQVGCADFLAQIEWPEPVRDPRVHPCLPEMDILDTIGRHMSHLTHWDARPERLVRTMEKLAVFVSFDAFEGEEVLSDLCLVSLEIVAQRWSHFLMESRRLGGISEPGLDLAVQALMERPVWEIDEIRDEMIDLIDRRIVEDSMRPKTLHERVAAIIHGTGNAGLMV